MKRTRWIYLRLALGLAQMTGALAALLLLLANGLIPAVWWLALGAGAATLLSVLLFRVLRVDK